MILKLLVDFYAWVWNVEPWRPVTREDYIPVVMSAVFIDPIAVIAIGFAVIWAVRKLKRGSK